jgi:hypothetical protein
MHYQPDPGQSMECATLLTLEAAFGIAGLIAAPIYCYLKDGCGKRGCAGHELITRRRTCNS